MADTGPEARSFHAMDYDSGEVAIVIRLPKITAFWAEQFHAQLWPDNTTRLSRIDWLSSAKRA
jgi:hypothetical protein